VGESSTIFEENKMKLIHGTLLSALLALTALNANAGHHESEQHFIPNLKNAVDQLMGAFEKESVEMFDDVMAKDAGMVTFGTDASERWVGFDEVRDSFAKQIGAFEVERIDTRNQVIKTSSSGEVAWFSQIVDWHISSGGNSQTIPGIRVTGVLEKRGAEWKIVQFHTSAPVQGQVVEY
jgi:hypothetical protein